MVVKSYNEILFTMWISLSGVISKYHSCFLPHSCKNMSLIFHFWVNSSKIQNVRFFRKIWKSKNHHGGVSSGSLPGSTRDSSHHSNFVQVPTRWGMLSFQTHALNRRSVTRAREALALWHPSPLGCPGVVHNFFWVTMPALRPELGRSSVTQASTGIHKGCFVILSLITLRASY